LSALAEKEHFSGRYFSPIKRNNHQC